LLDTKFRTLDDFRAEADRLAGGGATPTKK
jgi:hypothetical protein